MPELIVGETVVSYTLKRSAVAKKARITVTPDQVEVVVPEAANDQQIAKVLEKKRAWIFEHHQRMNETLAGMHTIRRFTTGAKIPYRGRLAKLTIDTTGGEGVEVAYQHGIHVSCPEWVSDSNRDEIVETHIRIWMKSQLRRDVMAMARTLEVRHGLKPRAIRIKDQKNLWGSCGKDKVVNLNWRLVFAPKQVLLYALVHEMAHLKERSHSDAFWSLVRSMKPDYQAQKEWLEKNEHMLGYRVLPIQVA